MFLSLLPKPDGPQKTSLREQISGTIELLRILIAPPKSPTKPKASPPSGEAEPSAGSVPAESRPSFFARHPRAKRVLWQRKFSPAFWTTASIFSLVVNAILIVVIIILGRQLFFLKQLISDHLINGLYDNFVLMDQANIITDIQVNTTMPVRFDLPLDTDTTVVLTDDTPIPNTMVNISTDVISLKAPAEVTLPKGTPLNIHLQLTVPVSATIPVNIPVHVDIPLDQTELHAPFVGLQGVVKPFREILAPLPNAWEETPFCGASTRWLCQMLLGVK